MQDQSRTVKQGAQGSVEPFPGFENFYLLDDPLLNRPFRGQIDLPDNGLRLTRGESQINAPLRVTWAMGGAALSDFVWTTSLFPLIVHERVVELLDTAQLNGWKRYPVTLVDKKGCIRADFSGLQILGRCGPLTLSGAVVVLKEYPGGWVPHLRGHYFEKTTWDGSDFFMHEPLPDGGISGNIIVSAAVRSAFLRGKVRNVQFTRLTDYCVSTSTYEIGLSHLLPADFKERVDAAYAEAAVPRPGKIRPKD